MVEEKLRDAVFDLLLGPLERSLHVFDNDKGDDTPGKTLIALAGTCRRFRLLLAGTEGEETQESDANDSIGYWEARGKRIFGWSAAGRVCFSQFPQQRESGADDCMMTAPGDEFEEQEHGDDDDLDDEYQANLWSAAVACEQRFPASLRANSREAMQAISCPPGGGNPRWLWRFCRSIAAWRRVRRTVEGGGKAVRAHARRLEACALPLPENVMGHVLGGSGGSGAAARPRQLEIVDGFGESVLLDGRVSTLLWPDCAGSVGRYFVFGEPRDFIDGGEGPAFAPLERALAAGVIEPDVPLWALLAPILACFAPRVTGLPKEVELSVAWLRNEDDDDGGFSESYPQVFFPEPDLGGEAGDGGSDSEEDHTERSDSDVFAELESKHPQVTRHGTMTSNYLEYRALYCTQAASALSREIVERYRVAIRAGVRPLLLAAQPRGTYQDYVLLDGHHKLAAYVLEDVGPPLVVIRNAPVDGRDAKQSNARGTRQRALFGLNSGTDAALPDADPVLAKSKARVKWKAVAGAHMGPSGD
jgi:hypothetical protein